MLKGEFKIKKEQDLSEKCRKALEKSFGTSIPMPNSLSKKSRFYAK
jgi:hypothetical protein